MRQWRKPLTSLAHARSNILRLSKGIWCIQYVADCLRQLIIREDSANPCLFQQCASDVNDSAYVTGV